MPANRGSRAGVVLLTASACLQGCATYQAAALPATPDFLQDMAHLTVDRAKLDVPELKSHPFDPSDGLDMDEVAMLAVVNNADLRVARGDAGIAHAQAFAAGLVPDPQVSLGYAPAPGNAGATSAFNVGLAFDMAALLSQPSRKRAGRADDARADLTVLWQEWQVVSQARLLFLRVIYQDRSAELLRDTRVRFEDRYLRTKSALDRGLLASDAVSPHLSALQDVDRQLNDLERQGDQSRHDLNLLLGLAPGVHLDLVAGRSVPPLDEAAIRRLLPELPRRRPDLLALESGFEAEDARYRAALLAQFPTLTFGPAFGRDTSNVRTLGIAATIGLPLFSGNRGAIAVELATRQKLRDDYQARLDAAAAEIDRLLAGQVILDRQLTSLDRSVAATEQSLASAQRAFDAGNLDALILTNIEASALGRRLEQLAAQQSMAEQRVMLRTIIGGELPGPAAGVGS